MKLVLTSEYGCFGEAAGAAAWQHHCAPLRALRVWVYAGQGPVTKKSFYLTATVPPGPRQAQEAEQLKIRFLNQVDEGGTKDPCQ
jgi:hypothetical protein